MARPLKDERLLMNVPVKIMVTAEQKALFDEAAIGAMLDLSAWARLTLLEAAKKAVSPANLAPEAPSKRKK